VHVAVVAVMAAGHLLVTGVMTAVAVTVPATGHRQTTAAAAAAAGSTATKHLGYSSGFSLKHRLAMLPCVSCPSTTA
jgi:hypothetical protein